MSRQPASLWRLALAGLLLCAMAACQSPAPTPLPHVKLVRSQLAQIVQAQGYVCVQVAEHWRVQRLDYRVACESGQVYRVWVGADGQVMVQPQDAATPAVAPPVSTKPPASAPN
jgi:uncharacterized membrane protein